MSKSRVLVAMLLAAGAMSQNAVALSRSEQAYDVARTFVSAFLSSYYSQAAAVSTFDPSTRISWFKTRFPANDPFTYFRLLDVEPTAGGGSVVRVRISGASTVNGLYLLVDSRGKIADMLSIRELLTDCHRDLTNAWEQTEAVLDKVEGRKSPPSAVRGALREQRREAAQCIDIIERHLNILEGKEP